ncbi:MAG: DMT family transporter [Shimia sp.]
MDNLRGAALMTLAMLGFAIEDAFIKALAADWPTGQIIAALGLASTPVFAAFCKTRGIPLLTRDALRPAVLLRNASEVFGTLSFVTALTLVPLALASAILQAAPLLVTLGAALFLGQAVGPRRWAAILVGLLGVLIILRPGLEGFDINALFAVAGVIGLAARDVATRAIPANVPSPYLATLAVALLIPSGLLLMAIQGTPPGALSIDTLRLFAGAFLTGLVAYAAIVSASRIGDVAAVTPFRYSRLIFALLIGMIIFGERPDALTLIGAARVIASGLYTLARESRLRHHADPKPLQARTPPG